MKEFLMGISLNTKISLVISSLIMVMFLIIQTCIVFRLCEPTLFLAKFGLGCIISFIPPFFLVVKEFLINKAKISKALNQQILDFQRFEQFVQESVIVTKADKRAKITYVNKKFEDVAGWKSEEVVGKDHVIVNSNTQPVKYWKNMYDTVHKGEIWHDIVTNKTKDGEFYYVDTYIKANFDPKGELEGYTSLRQDFTDIFKATEEMLKKMFT